jgi:iron complex outermembrane receptor protein
MGPAFSVRLLGGEMTKNLLLLTCATGALGLWAGVSQAATAAAAATDTSQGATNVTEIVVTAEKREQSLQKVPVAVSVFTGAQRDTIGINTVADVTNFAPGFSYDPANVHAYIRGVGRQSVNVTDDQRVANYEDEFYVYSPYGLDKSSLFLSQVQIERGPQSVGGRNAAAGSIDMISVRPTDEPYAELRATIGNFGTHVIEGAISGQVAPGLDLRIAGFDKNQDQGYYKNLIGAQEGNVIHEWYVEGQLDWKPNDKFELWARTFYEAWNGRGDAGSRTGFDSGSWDETALVDGNSYVAGGLFINPNFGYAAPNGNPTANAALAAHNAANLATPAGLAFLATHPGLGAFFPGNDPIPTSVTLINPSILNNPAIANHNNFAAQFPRNVKLNNYDDFNYIATYHASNFDIKYNGGFQGYNYYLNDPGDGPGQNSNVLSYTLPTVSPLIPALVIHPQVQANYVEDDFWTAHDLTFQSTSDSPFQWTAGAFYFYQSYNQPYTVFDNAQPQLAQPISVGLPCGVGPAPGLCAPNPNNYILYLDYNFTVESVAGYGQASYKFNDKFKISANIRENFDNKFGTETSRYIDFNPNTAVAATGGLPFYSVLGAGTPSIDLTAVLSCPTGVPTSCNSGPLAPGVKSKGVVLPNGFIQRQLGITSNAITGGGEIEWTPTPDIFTYARYGRGYESPSFNAGQNIALPAVKPEYLNAYEIGYKQSFGKNLLIDIAGYYYDYQALQVPLSINNGGVTQALFVNVPKSISEGVEFEAYWTPIRDLVITASYSYDHTAIQTGCTGTLSAPDPVTGQVHLIAAQGSLCVLDTNDPGAVQPGANPFPGQTTPARVQSVKGNPLPDAPANKFAIAVAYTFHFDPGDLVLSGDFAYRDKQDATLFNRFYDNAPSWNDLSLRATWKGPHDRYEITGFVKNVTDSLQYTVAAGGAGLAGSATAVGLNEVNSFNINPPRTYGVEMRYKFF